MASDPLIDSAIIIDHFRGHPDAISFLRDVRSAGTLVTHVAVVAEVLAGAFNRREQNTIDQLFKSFTVLPFNEADAAVSIDLLKLYRLSHGVGWIDCIIVATAMRHGVAVATMNVKHFAAIPNLQVIRPY